MRPTHFTLCLFATTLALTFGATGAALAEKSGQTTAPAPTPPSLPAPTAPTADASGVVWGDDAGRYPNDGECDDRRFAGAGMAIALSWESTGHDATDCRTLSEQGRVRLWDSAAAVAATQCTALDFGNDSGEYANDLECDDMRFEGRGMAFVVNNQSIGLDATDCRAYCQYGTIGLRDY